MNVMLFSLPTYFGMEHTYEWAGLFGILNVAFGTLSLLVGGLYFLSRGVQALRERVLHIDLPIAIGIIGAYVDSLYGWLVGEERFVYFDFVSAFILLMLVGRWAQVSAVDAHGANDALMLSDGANDSLAFDRALCRGTPVIHRGVLERKADFYYLGQGIGGLRALFEVDAVRRRTQLVILIFSVAYNLLAVGLAAAGHMNPLLAAILMPVNALATLLIVTTGMRGCATRELSLREVDHATHGW